MERKRYEVPPERKEGQPDGDDDVINKYGTYEVQRTCDTGSEYPMIAQGLPKEQALTMSRAARRWRNRKPE